MPIEYPMIYKNSAMVACLALNAAVVHAHMPEYKQRQPAAVRPNAANSRGCGAVVYQPGAEFRTADIEAFRARCASKGDAYGRPTLVPRRIPVVG